MDWRQAHSSNLVHRWRRENWTADKISVCTTLYKFQFFGNEYVLFCFGWRQHIALQDLSWMIWCSTITERTIKIFKIQIALNGCMHWTCDAIDIWLKNSSLMFWPDAYKLLRMVSFTVSYVDPWDRMFHTTCMPNFVRLNLSDHKLAFHIGVVVKTVLFIEFIDTLTNC